jgi:PAS domain S-box-containing protein
MLKWIKSKWQEWNSCKIDNYFGKLDQSMQAVIDKCERIERQLDAEVKLLTEEVALYKGMLHSVAETLPDMMWCKDVDGKYVYANGAIKKGLLFDMNPVGKTDVEMATKAKEYFGDENHTFGEKCRNSDKIVLDTNKPERFLESGKIKGRMLYLEVFKAPWTVNGELRGVVGTGRDMTEYVEAYKEQNCGSCGRMADIFKKYEYGE